MVLFKRKPITPAPRLDFLTNDTEIWHLKHTGEIFTSYETYIERLDYYGTKNFTCEITGHTNLTFFDALKSETQGSKDVENAFPDPLRGPLLRKVQFSTISRIDELVNSLFESFKEDFFPGERVAIVTEGRNERMEGTIRDKASFPEIRRSDGSVEREAMARYVVTLGDHAQEEVMIDNKHIFRDRRCFSKQVLRSFLKNNITRERWEGAPWLVKDHIAKQFHIDSTVPLKLRFETVMAEKKAQLAAKRGKHSDGRSRDSETHGLAARIKIEDPPRPSFSFSVNTTEMPIRGGPVDNMSAPIKYPIEDLEVFPKKSASARPAFKSWYEDNAQSDERLNGRGERQALDCIGTLLEIWNTLNVYTKVFMIDSFTFDDFVEAMQFTSDSIDCELFAEVHCAILTRLVDREGEAMVELPSDSESESESEDEEGQDKENNEQDGNESEESEEVEVIAPRRSRRKSAIVSPAKVEVETEEDQPNSGHEHQARAFLGDKSWRERLRERDFASGGWQIIMIGFLNQMSHIPRKKEICDEILSILAPVGDWATADDARKNYMKLSLPLRVAALQMATMLAISTKAVKGHIEACTLESTQARKEKIEEQKKKKLIWPEFHALDLEKRLLEPGTGENGFQTDEEEDAVLAEPEGEINTIDDSEDDVPVTPRVSRRKSGRAELKRKREEEEELKAQKAEQERMKKELKVDPQYWKILPKWEKLKDEVTRLDDKIQMHTDRIRELDCAKTKCLGKDRFWNRYYWFERNGMHYTGDPNSSSAESGYVNGRVWVQGPSEMEKDGYFDLSESDMRQYELAFGMTTHERRDNEEGPTHLASAHQWGYYDDPKDIDGLIAWLDDRGVRERKLRKELVTWREQIAECMDGLHEHKAQLATKRASAIEPSRGIATRKKAFVDQTANKYPCLSWHNSIAEAQMGRIHSGSMQPAQVTQIKTSTRARPGGFTAANASVNVNEPRSTRQGGRRK